MINAPIFKIVIHYKVIKTYTVLYSYGKKILVYVLTFSIAGIGAFKQFYHNSAGFNSFLRGEFKTS